MSLRQLLVIFTVLLLSSFQAQEKEMVQMQAANKALLKDSIWQYQEGDNIAWSAGDFDDSSWPSIKMQTDLTAEQLPSFDGIVWFRKTLKVPLEYRNQVLGLMVRQNGASQLFLDGELIKTYGTPSVDSTEEVVFNPNMVPLPVFLDTSEQHTIAIRYSDHHMSETISKYGAAPIGFHMAIGNYDTVITTYIFQRVTNTRILVFLGTFFFTLGLLHLIIFLFYRKKRNNLFYSLFALCVASFCFIPEIQSSSNDPLFSDQIRSALRYIIPLFLGTFHALLYSLFYKKMPKIFWIMLGLMCLLFILLGFQLPFAGLLAILMSFAVFVDSFRICVVAVRKKKRGAKIVGSGVLFLLLTSVGFIIALFIAEDNSIHVDGSGLWAIMILGILILAILSLPISMSIYLAWDISMTNVELEKQLVQVKELSEQSIRQEQEKKRILEGQKEKLEAEVRERTREIRVQKEELEIKNKDIMDSITYAKRIQDAILPPNRLVKEWLPQSFILYKPKDIVAGDFYWMESVEDTVIFAAADCTGHGVPGAMVSVVCHNALNRAVREFGLRLPGEILDKTRELVVATFEKSEQDVKDGMDIALCTLKGNLLKYAGAHNPIWLIRDGVLIETKATKQPIGLIDEPKQYETHTFELQKGDIAYIFSDGFADQFGGEKGKKFKTSNFKTLLLSVSHETLERQRDLINETFDNWKGNLEQLDDVCIIGVRI